MKTLLFLLVFMFPLTAFASERCMGDENMALLARLEIENRFSSCKKGDIISVYVVSLAKGFSKSSDNAKINDFSHRMDEVATFCSFENSIVETGNIPMKSSIGVDMDVIWFDCIYAGGQRNTTFSEEKNN